MDQQRKGKSCDPDDRSPAGGRAPPAGRQKAHGQLGAPPPINYTTRFHPPTPHAGAWEETCGGDTGHRLGSAGVGARHLRRRGRSPLPSSPARGKFRLRRPWSLLVRGKGSQFTGLDPQQGGGAG